MKTDEYVYRCLTLYQSIHGAVGTLHTCLLLSNFQQMHLLDISRQLACMKLGRREKYQPIQYCWAGCLGYPVHTCHLPIDIQQIYCSVQTGQHSCLRRSCCPVWALQHICTSICTCTCTCTYICWKLLRNRGPYLEAEVVEEIVWWLG